MQRTTDLRPIFFADLSVVVPRLSWLNAITVPLQWHHSQTTTAATSTRAAAASQTVHLEALTEAAAATT